VVGRASDVFERLRAMPYKLADIADRIAQGIRTSANQVFVLDIISASGDLSDVYSEISGRVTVESDLLLPFVQGREIKAYAIMYSGKAVLVPYVVRGQKAQLIPERDLLKDYPRAHAYFRQNKAFLEAREKGRMKGPQWFGYVYPKNIELMRAPKLLVPDIADRAAFAFDSEGRFAFTSGYAVTLRSRKESVRYVLGLLNSALLSFFLRRISTPMRGGFFRYFTQFLQQLPIHTIDFSDAADVARHDRMVALVESMLDLHKRLAAATLPDDKALYQRQIETTDRQIDALVYELYGLSDEEIAIVEEATR
jgi:hypothetical protein